MCSQRDVDVPEVVAPWAHLPGLDAGGGSYNSTVPMSETVDGEWLEAEPFSIRIPTSGGEIHCPRCRAVFRAEGPTGFDAVGPICDLCLLQGSHGLGMLLALASVARAFGRCRVVDLGEKREALEELWAFTKIYETVAARSGPPRFFSFWRWGRDEDTDPPL